MDKSDSGRKIARNYLHSLNALFPIVVSAESHAILASVKFQQSSNALSPITFTTRNRDFFDANASKGVAPNAFQLLRKLQDLNLFTLKKCIVSYCFHLRALFKNYYLQMCAFGTYACP